MTAEWPSSTQDIIKLCTADVYSTRREAGKLPWTFSTQEQMRWLALQTVHLTSHYVADGHQFKDLGHHQHVTAQDTIGQVWCEWYVIMALNVFHLMQCEKAGTCRALLTCAWINTHHYREIHPAYTVMTNYPDDTLFQFKALHYKPFRVSTKDKKLIQLHCQGTRHCERIVRTYPS